MAMLEVNHLAIQFGGLRAVDGFNVSIEKGQLYGRKHGANAYYGQIKR